MRRRTAVPVLAILMLWAAGLPLIVSCALDNPTPPEEPRLVSTGVLWNGIDRTYATYAPPSLAASPAAVLLLHGGFSSATALWESEFAQSWKALADAHGFLLVLPEGRADPGNPAGHHWNDCRVDIDNADSSSAEDDVGFIRHVLELVAARFGTNDRQIYVTGASNGGMMTYRLAMQLGETFAAAAAVIANLPDPAECPFAAEPLPILIMNGTLDPAIPYDGGCVAGQSCERGSVRSTAATVAFWVLSNGAATTPAITDLPDVIPSDGSTIRVFRFADATGGNDVLLYRVEGGGHCPPGPSPFPAVNKNRDIDAAMEIWDFFAAHVRAAP